MKNYSGITLALIVGLISFHSYAADDMADMDHSNMTPEQMKQMKKEMDHSKMTPEQMKDMPAATPAETPTATKVGEGMPENSSEKAVKKSTKKKMTKKVKNSSMSK